MLPLGLPQDQLSIRSTWPNLERIGELLGASLLSGVDLAYIYQDNLILLVLHLNPIPIHLKSRCAKRSKTVESKT